MSDAGSEAGEKETGPSIGVTSGFMYSNMKEREIARNSDTAWAIMFFQMETATKVNTSRERDMVKGPMYGKMVPSTLANTKTMFAMAPG
jgi:hypothetical protein